MIQDNHEIISDPNDPLVETSATADIIRPPEISVVPGDTGYGICDLYEDPIDGQAIHHTVPLPAVEEALETDSPDEADWPRADK